MKKGIIIIGIVIGVFGLTAFALVEKQSDQTQVEKPVVEGNDPVGDYFGLESDDMNRPLRLRELDYRVQGRNNRPVSLEKLTSAKLVGDIIPYYPSSWMTEYISVEILTTYNGSEISAMGPNDVLTVEQKKVFASIDIPAEIEFNVRYKSQNVVTKKIEDRLMNVSFSVIPEVKAEYIGGYDQMITYLKESSKGKVSAKDFNPANPATVFFTVNAQGEVGQVELDHGCGDAEIDKLAVELVKSMPKWKPANNSRGVAVKQNFRFVLGFAGC